MNNPWILLPNECQQDENQFFLLQPVNGLISGNQARPFFLKSGLPPHLLAQIWQLADISNDGKLDKLEFFIAMRLLRNCLKGLVLPTVLPDSLKKLPSLELNSFILKNSSQNGQQPISAYSGTLPANFGSMTSSLYSNCNASFSGQNSMSNESSFTMGIKELGNWSIPQHSKLRFSQQFNHLDRNRIGMLTGVQARGVLGESQLPTNILAQIWTMSDVNKDGCLNIEEFCVAMYLIEIVKSGFALPDKLPSELNYFCNRSKTVSPLSDPSVPPPQRHGSLKTFEDKRRDNLDRGQAELERRRQILRQEEERRRAEIERKEREEEERREKERQEIEKKKEAEREAERLKELEIEREKAAEEERLKLEREKARKRLEQERLKELEKLRIRDLESQYQNELEKTTQFQQRHKTMSFQIQAMEERSQHLNNEVTKARDEIIQITSEIEKMRENRDQKVAKISELQNKSQQLAVQCEMLSHENLQLQSECQKKHCRTQEIKNLKNKIEEYNIEIDIAEEESKNVEERLINQEKLVLAKRPEFEKAQEKLQKALNVYNKLIDKLQLLKAEAEMRENIKKKGFFEQNFKENDITRTYSLPPIENQESDSQYKTKSFDTVFSDYYSSFVPNFNTAFTNANSFHSQNNLNKNNPSFSSRQTADFEFNSAKKDSKNMISTSKSSTDFVFAAQTNSDDNSVNNSGSHVTARYRALYEFVARFEDELSLQPGDIILVFEDHASEPGWLAGQIKDKVGWFPTAFAEKIQTNDVNKKPIMTLSSVANSPSGEPLAIIKEESNVEKDFVTDFSSAFKDDFFLQNFKNQPTNGTKNSETKSNQTNSVLYDSPPILNENNETSPLKKKQFINNDDKVIGVGTALYQWKARNETELSFNRKDLIEILEQKEMRWRGRLQKHPENQGWFPKSYVKLLDGSNEEETERKISKVIEKSDSINSNNSNNFVPNLLTTTKNDNLKNKINQEGEWYVALYQFDAVEPSDLTIKPGDLIFVTETKDEWWKGICNQKTGIFPANYVQKVSLNQNGKYEWYVALYQFDALEPTDLPLKPGDIIFVIESKDEWWKGICNQKTGMFPGNYVQRISPNQIPQLN